jgi:hypothetical protein
MQDIRISHTRKKMRSSNRIPDGEIYVSGFGGEDDGVVGLDAVPQVDTLLRHSLMVGSMYLCLVERRMEGAALEAPHVAVPCFFSTEATR